MALAKRFYAALALTLAGCIPAPQPAPSCVRGARKCSSVATPLLCDGARWIADRTTAALRCE